VVAERQPREGKLVQAAHRSDLPCGGLSQGIRVRSFAPNSLLEEPGFEPPVLPRNGRPWRKATRRGHRRLARRPVHYGPSSLSARHLPSATTQVPVQERDRWFGPGCSSGESRENSGPKMGLEILPPAQPTDPIGAATRGNVGVQLPRYCRPVLDVLARSMREA
jgi:hypothetical protein